MNAKVFGTVAVVAVLGVVAAVIVATRAETVPGQVEGQTVSQKPQPVTAVGAEYADLIRQSLAQARPLDGAGGAHLGITSHHLPTAASFIARFYRSLSPANASQPVFVVIGPDHFEHCGRDVATTRRDYSTPFGLLLNNQVVVSELEQNAGVAEVDDCFDGEHSIGVQAMYLKLLYPDSTIVPVVYSSAASAGSVERVAQTLAQYGPELTVVVSVDFSHYQSTAVANQLDQDSARMIQRLDGTGLTLKQLDSPASIKTILSVAKLHHLTAVLAEHANSAEFTGQTENTTGYWNVFFRSEP